MTEDELLHNVIDLAHLLKWRVAHFRSVPVKHGERVVYQTPVQADGAGFPDLVLVRERVIFAELKSATGRLSTDQQDWLYALGQADAERRVWYPRDWNSGHIQAVLRSDSTFDAPTMPSSYSLATGPGHESYWRAP